MQATMDIVPPLEGHKGSNSPRVSLTHHSCNPAKNSHHLSQNKLVLLQSDLPLSSHGVLEIRIPMMTARRESDVYSSKSNFARLAKVAFNPNFP